MKLGVLFSGGKDSCLALYKAMQKEEVSCLITVISENKESFMFHTPNISITEFQSEAMKIPIIKIKTKGEKEKELEDLKKVIKNAIEEYEIEGVVTGAIESVYQATRIQKICNELDIWCFNPLWQKNQVDILNELVDSGFEVLITGVFAEPFGSEWLGRTIDKRTVLELEKMSSEYFINPSGEGGEIETTVLDSPLFNKKIKVDEFSSEYKRYSGLIKIKKASLVEK